MRASVSFGELAPDLPPLNNPGLLAVSNALPAGSGYRPVRSLSPLRIDPLPERPLGAIACQDLAGKTHLVVGTRASLWAYRSSGWLQIASGYSTTEDHGWSFAQFGNNLVATNGVDKPQNIVLPAIGGDSVRPLGGNPPRMRYLGVVREFVVGGVVNDDNLQFAWCGQNNVEQWTAGQNQAGFGVLSEGGPITGIVGGEYGLLFQKHAISMIDYIGGNIIFSRNKLFSEIGCVAPRSLVRYADMTFFLSEHGFAMMRGVSQPVLIGSERVTRTFEQEMSQGFYRRMSAAVDPINRVILWTAPISDSSTKAYAYHWELNKWSVLDTGAVYLVTGYSPGLGIDDLGAIYPGIDLVPESLDSLRWQGGFPALYGFTANGRVGTFTGANAEARFLTGDFELAGPSRARLYYVRPLVACKTLLLRVGSRNDLAQSPTFRSYVDLRNSGRIPVRENARYFRFEVTIQGGVEWSAAQGLEVDYVAAGAR